MGTDSAVNCLRRCGCCRDQLQRTADAVRRQQQRVVVAVDAEQQVEQPSL
jgi:hypothetical protein